MLPAISVGAAGGLLDRAGHLVRGRGLLLHRARRWWSAGRRSARRWREISSIAATAAVVSPWIASTRRAMSSVAFAVSCASSLTSLATTAKPLPASPARAASIVAFSASRFVCSAMLVITLTTLPISAEDSPSLATVAVVVSAAVTARAATSLASAALRGDLPDGGAHLLRAGGDGLHVAGDLLGGAGHHARLRRGLLGRGRDLRRATPTAPPRRRPPRPPRRRPSRARRAGSSCAASSAAAIRPSSSPAQPLVTGQVAGRRARRPTSCTERTVRDDPPRRPSARPTARAMPATRRPRVIVRPDAALRDAAAPRRPRRARSRQPLEVAPALSRRPSDLRVVGRLPAGDVVGRGRARGLVLRRVVARRCRAEAVDDPWRRVMPVAVAAPVERTRRAASPRRRSSRGRSPRRARRSASRGRDVASGRSRPLRRVDRAEQVLESERGVGGLLIRGDAGRRWSRPTTATTDVGEDLGGATGPRRPDGGEPAGPPRTGAGREGRRTRGAVTAAVMACSRKRTGLWVARGRRTGERMPRNVGRSDSDRAASTCVSATARRMADDRLRDVDMAPIRQHSADRKCDEGRRPRVARSPPWSRRRGAVTQ